MSRSPLLASTFSTDRRSPRRWLLAVSAAVLIPSLAAGWVRLRTPQPVERFSVACERDGLSCQIAVDLFRPSGADPHTRYPAILLLHGVEGAERFARGHAVTAQDLADQGYAVFFVHYFDAVDYRDLWLTDAAGKLDTTTIAQHCYRDAPRWTAAVTSVLSAVARRDDVDPSFIALSGYSLGCYIALAATEQSLHSAQIPTVSAVVGHWGSQFATTHFPVGFPPVLQIHGQLDSIVPLAEAEAAHKALRDAGVDTQLHVVPGAGHLAESEESQAAVRDFLRQSRIQRTHAQPDSAAFRDELNPRLAAELIARFERGLCGL